MCCLVIIAGLSVQFIFVFTHQCFAFYPNRFHYCFKRVASHEPLRLIYECFAEFAGNIQIFTTAEKMEFRLEVLTGDMLSRFKNFKYV